MKSKQWLTLALAVVLAGCASGSAGEGTQRTTRVDRYVISAEEIAAATRYNTAFEMVQALRPGWMRGRSMSTFSNPNAAAVTVYADGTRLGDTGVLHQIKRSDVVSLQYLDANDATTRFGTGHTGGVILVGTRPTP